MAKSPGQELDDLIAEMRATAVQRIRTVEQEHLELRWAETLERLRLPDVSLSPAQELERLINKIYALADRLRAPSVSPAQSLDQLIAKWRDRSRPPQNRYGDTGAQVRLATAVCADELEAVLAFRAPSRATPEEQSPAVKKAMERFWRRCAEVDIEAIILAVAELPDRTSPDDWPEAMLVTADELRAILSASRATSVTVDLSIDDMRNAHAREKP